METVNTVDYAPHYLRAKVLLGEIYKLLNERDFNLAEQLTLDLIVESRLLHNAVRAQK